MAGSIESYAAKRKEVTKIMTTNVVQKCYLCFTTKNLTNDHVPPRNLFLKPYPENLITVKCCYSCNNSLKLDDEAFRVFAASQLNRSAAGDWIWENKVMGSTFIRSPKLKENIKKSIILLEKDPKTGKPTTWGLQYPIPRGERYLIRLTKGLIRNYNPNLDYSNSNFKITHIIPSQNIIDNVLAKFPLYDEKGEGVFRMWSVFIESNKPASVWVFTFYDALMFMVEVDLI